MTGSFPAPTWGDIDRFCEADGWTDDGSTDHVFWEKVLPNGELLQTHRSFSANTEIGVDLFRMILREQLKVSRGDFWNAISTGEPVERPVEIEDSPVFEIWVVRGLMDHGYTEHAIKELGPDAAKALLHQLWSKPPEGETHSPI